VLSLPILLFALAACAPETAPIRESVSLNGVWDFYPAGGTERFPLRVPSFWDAPQDHGGPAEWLHMGHGVYRRTFTVPVSFRDRSVFLRIERVSVLARVFVNGQPVGGETTRGYLMMQLPYSMDVTRLIRFDGPNDLEVRVWGGKSLVGIEEEFRNSEDFPADCFDDGKLLFPWCVDHYDGRRGINGDVTLEAVSKIRVAGVFVLPDLNRSTDPADDRVSLRLAVANDDSSEKSVTIRNTARLCAGGGVKRFEDRTLVIPPGSERTVLMEGVPWPNARLWWPHEPNLYVLETVLEERGRLLDRVETRFGMRQFFADGNRYRLNGIPCALRAESFEFSWHEPMRHGPGAGPRFSTAELAVPVQESLLREYAALNLNALRPHKASGIEELYDRCDETGMLVIDEAPFWQTQQRTDGRAAPHFREWARRWVAARRNHPSVVLWSVANESWHSPVPPAVYEAVREADPTRPAYHQGVMPSGDFEGDAQVVHYTGGYPMGAFNTGAPYAVYANHPSKPKGEGESAFADGFPLKNPDGSLSERRSARAESGHPDMVSCAEWARGAARLIRAMRFAGLADSRSYANWMYCFDPVEADVEPEWKDPSGPGLHPVLLRRPVANPFGAGLPPILRSEAREYWRASCSAVAVFDSAFDAGNRIGAEPAAFAPGDTLRRRLLVYHDALTGGERVDVDWRAGTLDPRDGRFRPFDSGRIGARVPHGERRAFSLAFAVPARSRSGEWLVLRLAAAKDGRSVFIEDNRLGAVGAPPAPLLTARAVMTDLGGVSPADSSQWHKITLVNRGGGLSEKWIASTAPASDEFVPPLWMSQWSGNLRAEQDVYFRIRTGGLEKGPLYRTRIEFDAEHGSRDAVTVRYRIR
jgi:hypothetical protein